MIDLAKVLVDSDNEYISGNYANATKGYLLLLENGLKRTHIYSNCFLSLYKLGELAKSDQIYHSFLEYLLRHKNFMAANSFRKLLDDLKYSYAVEDFIVFQLLKGDYKQIDLVFKDIPTDFLTKNYDRLILFELFGEMDYTKKLPQAFYQLKLWSSGSYKESINLLYYLWYYYGDSLFNYYFLAKLSLDYKRITFRNSLEMFFSQKLYINTSWRKSFERIEEELKAFYELHHEIDELTLSNEDTKNLLNLLEEIEGEGLKKAQNLPREIILIKSKDDKLDQLEQSIIKQLEKMDRSFDFLTFAMLSGLYQVALFLIEKMDIPEELNDKKIDYFYLKNEILIKLGRFFLAKEELENILKFWPINDEEKMIFKYQLAEVLYGLRQSEEAYKIYKELEIIRPDYRLVRLRIRDIEAIT